MDSEILYKSVMAKEDTAVSVDYYIIPESIGNLYTNLKCYGIKIEKTTLYDGGGKTIDIRQINNVFYRYDDVAVFLDEAVRRRVEPETLASFVEKYIIESLDRAKQKA